MSLRFSSRPRDSGEGGPPKAVGGARAATLFAATTTKRRVRGPLHHASLTLAWSPSPALAGADNSSPFPRHVFARECCQTTMSYGPQPVARMERSVIRVRSSGFTAAPGFHFVSSGLRNSYDQTNKRKRNAGRRGIPRPARNGARGAPRRRRLAPPFRFGRARLPAFHQRHLRQRPNAAAQLQFTHFLGRNELGAGVTHPLPSQYSGRCSPQAGRRAGRAFFTRSRPGADCKSARGNRTRPTCRLASGRRPFWARWRLKRFAGRVVKRATVRVRRGEESPHSWAFLWTIAHADIRFC